jgi:hypothetical protein
MKKNIFLFVFFPLILLLVDCKKDEINTTPYDPFTHALTVTAKINNIDFIADDITIGTPDTKKGSIFVAGKYNDNYIAFSFPIYCGETTFNFPNSNPDCYLAFNNDECKHGKLVIKNYDVNLVEGYFEFQTDKDSLVNVTEGKFSIVHFYR